MAWLVKQGTWLPGARSGGSWEVMKGAWKLLVEVLVFTPFQPPDFPEETLTSSHSQLETCCLKATWQTTYNSA